MIYDKKAAANIIGCLIKNPDLFANTDKYLLIPNDFDHRLHRIIFSVVYNLFHSGAEIININEIHEYLKNYPELYDVFNKQKGSDFILTSQETAELKNFNYYYDRIKKMSLLRSLKEIGFSIEDWYVEGDYDIAKRQELEKQLEKTSIQEIVASYQGKLYEVESTFINKKNFKFASVAEELETLFETLKEVPELGLPLQGKLFTTITRGARKSKLYCMSGGTSYGKTRLAIGNACKLAFPFYWNNNKERWENNGCNQKVIFITTELDMTEVQTVILSNISGINEEKILNGHYSEEESKRAKQAIQIIKHFGENFYLYHMPDPTIEQLNNNIRRLVITKKFDCVFFDYIHTSPQLIGEFSGMRIREDVALLMVSTSLKNLANELEVFVWTGTQVNASEADADFADESCLRGSRAIADKLDMGTIIRKVGQSQLKMVKNIVQQTGMKPNMCFDIYKNRRSKYNRVKLWCQVDLGTARVTDLFLTDEFGNQIPIDLLYSVDVSAKCDITELFSQTRKKDLTGESSEKPKLIEITF